MCLRKNGSVVTKLETREVTTDMPRRKQGTTRRGVVEV